MSNTTLRYERNTRAWLYAKAGVQEYWVLDPKRRTLEVFREPQAPHRKGYAASTVLTECEAVIPLCAPEVSIAVADFLPRRKGGV